MMRIALAEQNPRELKIKDKIMIQLTKLEDYNEALLKEIDNAIINKKCEDCKEFKYCPSFDECVLRSVLENFLKPLMSYT